MMTSLYSGCGAPIKRLARFPEGNHNETWSCSQYYQTINYFLDEVSSMFIPNNQWIANSRTL